MFLGNDLIRTLMEIKGLKGELHREGPNKVLFSILEGSFSTPFEFQFLQLEHSPPSYPWFVAKIVSYHEGTDE